MKRNSRLKICASLALCMAIAHVAALGAVVWSGAGGNLMWSTPGNWTGGVPGPSADVKFYDPGADPSQGNINNILDSSLTVASLQYANSNNFHSTQLAAGQILTVANGLTVGTGTSNGAAFQLTATMVGTGGTLAVTGGNIFIAQPDGSSGSHRATLDASGLDTLTATVSRALIAVQTSSSSPRRPAGTFNLARTNAIVASGTVPALQVGYGSSNGGNGIMELGQTNAIFANGIQVAGRKSTATMSLNYGYYGTAFALFRGANGSSRVPSWSIGDNSDQTDTTTSSSTGTVDLSGVQVDAQVETMYIGRSKGGNTGAANGTGTLTLDSGIFDVNTLNIGYQGATTDSAGIGTATVGPLATLVVSNTLELAHTTGGGGVANTSGTLNINGGTVRANRILIGGGGVSAINLNSGTLALTNGLGAPAAPIANFSLGDSLLQLVVGGSSTNIVVSTLAISSSTNNSIQIVALPLIPSYPAQFPLIAYSVPGWLYDFVLWPLPGGYVGYLSNNTAQSSVDLVITGGPISLRSLTWRGTPGADWDTSTSNWLYSGTATTYNEGDLVLFDDTAVGSTTVNLTTTLSPTSVTVNNSSKTYTFGGPGNLSGPTGLAKQGTGTLIVNNSGSNDFSGGISIAAGKLQLAGSDNRLPLSSAVTLADDSSAVLDLNNLNQTVGSLAGGGLNGGNVSLGSATLTLDGGSGVYNGLISGSGAVLKNGSGAQVLGGANLYTGGTTVSAGTLAVANLTGSGTGPGSVTVNTNATFAIGGGGPGGSVAVGFITNNGTVSFNRSDDFTLANVIVGDGGVTKNNTNIVLVPFSNSYTGMTTVSAGALRVSSPGALGSGPAGTYVQNDGSARLELIGGINLSEALTLACKGTALGNPPAVVNVSGSNTLSGPITATTGGSYWTFESDADKLTVAGTFTNNATSNQRTVRLRGTSLGEWQSTIIDSTGRQSVTGLLKEEPGTWLLLGSHTYTGNSVINGGVLAVNGSILNSTNLAVNGGALAGSGLINAPVTVSVNGTLAPGWPVSTLTISNSLSLSGTSIMEVSHAAADKVAGLASVSFGGTLQVLVIGPLTGGERFKLFEAASYAGDFATYDLPPLDPPLSWDTSQVASAGLLRVAGGAPPQPQIGEVTISGGNLVLSGNEGPTSGTFQVLTSTNVAAPLAAWTVFASGVFNPDGSFGVTNAINPAQPRAFYLIQVPW